MPVIKFCTVYFRIASFKFPYSEGDFNQFFHMLKKKKIPYSDTLIKIFDYIIYIYDRFILIYQ